MRLALSSEWLRPERAERGTTPGGEFRVTHAFRPDDHDGLQAYLVRSFSGEARVDTHFHLVEQFQVFVEGAGTFQRHPIGPGVVHFTDPYSTYGPIVAGAEGLGFFVLRQRFDAGGHYMPGSRDELVERPGRNMSATVPMDGPAGVVEPVIARQADGLGVDSLRLDPSQEGTPPSPAATGGQYLLVVAGTAMLDDAILDRLSLAHLHPDEQPVRLRAGPTGCTIVALGFPRHGATVEEPPVAAHARGPS